jgi:type VI secretion system secreted protein VgrG
MPVKQANRLMSVSTPLASDLLLIQSVAASERISTPFVISLDLLTEREEADSVKGKDLVGKPMTVRLQLNDDDKPRFFNGIVRRFVEGDRDERFQRFRAELVPWLSLLMMSSDLRIFQNETVPDILQKVFKDAGFSDFKLELKGKYEEWNYCVQYRETNFNFVSRLMEEEGIFYYFKHEEKKHVLVLADSPQGFETSPFQSKVRYAPAIGHGESEDVITTFERADLLRPGKYTLWDHTFELPHKPLDASRPTRVDLQKGGNQKWEMYDYPGGYAKRFDGINSGGGETASKLQKNFTENLKVTELRMQEEEAPGETYSGTSFCRGLPVGGKFTLEGNPDLAGDYVITSVEHTIIQSPDYVSNENVHEPYGNSFTGIPAGAPFRPPRTARKPFVQGLHTAVVVGPPGQEIFTDKYGRIKAQFHWDRKGQKNADSSCWMRVSHPWAGKQWGAIFIPRIGQEVVVAFVEGDPDRPIIVGSVYNADMMPPYTLPDNMTQSGIKTRSTMNGGSDNFNELRFEDKKGSEDIYFHAEKDFHRVVEHDDDLKVGHDQTIEIKNHRTETVVDGNETVTIKTGNRLVEVSKGNDDHNVKMGNRSAELGMGNESLRIKMGNQTTKLDLGKSETEAMQSIELKVGQSSVKVDQMGVTIKGMMIKIEGTIMVETKGLMVQSTADAMMMIKGAITMIN